MKQCSSPISVVMSVFNGQRYLREAIDSILDQSFADFEFIIIDDGSTDNTSKIILSYTDPRIRFIKQKNMGLAAALNRGIKLSNGKYIARMDADDISLPCRLEKQYQFMEENQHILALGSAVELIDMNGTHICYASKSTSYSELKRQLPSTPFVHPTVMFRRQVFFQAGGYPESFKWGGEDTVLFNKMAQMGQISNLSEPLLKYRISPYASTRYTVKYRNMLEKLTIKAANGLPISKDEFEQLKDANKKLSLKTKWYIYHLELSMKYLWYSRKPKLARSHLLKALHFNKCSLSALTLLCLSFLPPNYAQSICKTMYNFFQKIYSFNR
ncbi:Glycosyl transferase, group 2 family protein [Dissulfuribacter thermophilus]|uniref:Glycosyl transferase, group 2 family protein n=2 Tax=Dissulfuribacter thermophilus TaxID=1156395 RepID=A0A1B9F7R0_9BACT|nr:Glycosyl transferase, group 2 family protein [Dissulfuribacter thermophilus]